MSDDKQFPLAPLIAVKLVTPQRWDEIRKDPFVLGWVLASAFSVCERLRVTSEGFVFETDELSDEALERLGSQLDDEADQAMRTRDGLESNIIGAQINRLLCDFGEPIKVER